MVSSRAGLLLWVSTGHWACAELLCTRGEWEEVRVQEPVQPDQQGGVRAVSTHAVEDAGEEAATGMKVVSQAAGDRCCETTSTAAPSSCLAEIWVWAFP